jgi:hypothetical protein
MFARFERRPAFCNYSIRSIDWKGTAGQTDGWLASGNAKGLVGLTYTTEEILQTLVDSQSNEEVTSRASLPSRTNFNLREHTTDVTLVQWNKSQQHHRLTTCDSSGSIVVWMPYDGRWTIELINNRGLGTAVSQFQWSRDGSQALIAYTDGYVLVGSVHGQRLWSNYLTVAAFAGTAGVRNDETKLLAATWSPDDHFIVVADTAGELIKLDSQVNAYGRVVSINEVMVSRLRCSPSDQIACLHWFKHPIGSRMRSRLTIYTNNGVLAMLTRCSDPVPIVANSEITDGSTAWSADSAVLAVAGCWKNNATCAVRFFNTRLKPLYSVVLNCEYSITSVCWGLSDSRLFVAAGQEIHTAIVEKTSVASLQDLSKHTVAGKLKHEDDVSLLPLPTSLKQSLSSCFYRTIQGFDPEMMDQFEFVTYPPSNSHHRLFCTMVCHSDDPHIARKRSVATSHFTRYTLYIEYLGGLVPILKGHRTNRLKPTFSISLAKRRPTKRKLSRRTRLSESTRSHESLLSSDGTLSSGEEVDMSTQSATGITTDMMNVQLDTILQPDDTQSLSDFTDPSSRTLVGDPLVVVTSNMACTKFKMQGLDMKISQHLGSIVYKPSLLHLHPRKIAVLLPNPNHQLTGDFDQVADTTDLDLGDELEEVDDDGEKAIVSPTASVAHQYAERHMELGDVLRSQRYDRPGLNVCRDRSENESQILVMHNRTPVWNSQNQVYQLDFGGRVTQESAKNFQLELNGQQVLQFGRIGVNAYTLDFQFPFSPLQAFSLAMANLTQRLK